MKKPLILALLTLLVTPAFTQDYSDINNVIYDEINQLKEKGCSVNIKGIIAKEISENEYQIMIPHIGCNNSSEIGVESFILKRGTNGEWGNKQESKDTSIEKVTDYGGMASVTEHIEYTASKTETVVPK